MRTPPTLYGLLAEFETPEALLEAARQARRKGYRQMDAYSPFAIEELAEAVGFRWNLLPWLVLIGGFGGAGAGYYMMYYATVISYPINVAGRPLHSWPSYIPITFELGVLGASLTAILALFLFCGLPKPYHPVFNAERFGLESQGRFFLCIQAADSHFHKDLTRKFLTDQHASHVSEVEHWRPGRQTETESHG